VSSFLPSAPIAFPVMKNIISVSRGSNLLRHWISKAIV
jgi:hypothetical protein